MLSKIKPLEIKTFKPQLEIAANNVFIQRFPAETHSRRQTQFLIKTPSDKCCAHPVAYVKYYLTFRTRRLDNTVENPTLIEFALSEGLTMANAMRSQAFKKQGCHKIIRTDEIKYWSYLNGGIKGLVKSCQFSGGYYEDGQNLNSIGVYVGGKEQYRDAALAVSADVNLERLRLKGTQIEKGIVKRVIQGGTRRYFSVEIIEPLLVPPFNPLYYACECDMLEYSPYKNFSNCIPYLNNTYIELNYIEDNNEFCNAILNPYTNTNANTDKTEFVGFGLPNSTHGGDPGAILVQKNPELEIRWYEIFTPIPPRLNLQSFRFESYEFRDTTPLGIDDTVSIISPYIKLNDAPDFYVWEVIHNPGTAYTAFNDQATAARKRNRLRIESIDLNINNTSNAFQYNQTAQEIFFRQLENLGQKHYNYQEGQHKNIMILRPFQMKYGKYGAGINQSIEMNFNITIKNTTGIATVAAGDRTLIRFHAWYLKDYIEISDRYCVERKQVISVPTAAKVLYNEQGSVIARTGAPQGRKQDIPDVKSSDLLQGGIYISRTK